MQQQMVIARGDQDAATGHRIAVLRLLDLHRAEAVEATGEGGGEGLRHMLDDNNAGAVGWQGLQQMPQGLGAAGGGADANHAVGAADRLATGDRWRHDDVGRQLFLRIRRRGAAAAAGRRAEAAAITASQIRIACSFIC